ncbi:MAG: F0F1 ATP synthase subunit B [Paludibacter sp.]|mgnify:CR=1 FL=1|jgi:F-type H+-transporting ATPase subunit b|nr:F0F1 ATP synthase subunit B [Paludibacter sp.]MBP7611922.1 F0F1 ATP synthase subunit B [Paludibacter sp.]MBV5282619.1 F0F1 ATP synthase subunit B [Paludibacter sp.]
MSLLLPETGLLFWMLLSFGIVAFILVKFGFPVIINMVESRKTYIDESLLIAKQAYIEMDKVKAAGEAIVDNARREQVQILNEATQTRDLLIKDAKDRAQSEGQKMIDEARKQILIEKEDAIRDIRRQVAELSVDIAERVLREKLEKKGEQMDMINRLLDEINISKS